MFTAFPQSCSTLSRKAIAWSIVVAGFAAYCAWAHVQVLKEPAVIAAMLDKEGLTQSQEPVVVWLGRVIFFLIAGALTFNFGHAIAAAFQRYRYRITALPPLQPLNEEERAELLVQQPSEPNRPAAQQQRQQQAQQPARQGSTVDHDERRKRALEALQRDLDEKAAALKEKQRQEAEAKAARAAAAAAEKAAKAAQDATARQATLAAQSAHWDRWGQAVIQHNNAAAAVAASSTSSSTGPIATAAPLTEEQLAADRVLRETQDAEYNTSLKADAEKQRRQAQMSQLAAFRAALQEKLPSEAEAASGDGLAIRVRLPDGTNAVRQFAAPQRFEVVLDWVYSLPGMPLYKPTAWGLASSFPKWQLRAAEGLWAAGNYRPTDDLQEFCLAGSSLGYAHPATGYEVAERNVFSLTVRPLAGDSFTVQVLQSSSVYKVKQQVEQRLGIAPDKQRLIFAGQLLKDDLSLQHYKITSQHTLQLAVRVGESASSSSAATVVADATAASTGSSSGDAGGEGVLVVKDIAQLRADVAHGAPQLALYVVEF